MKVWFTSVLLGTFFFGGVVALVVGRPPSISAMLGDVGVAVGVAPNPYNSLNDQLNQKQEAINQAESNLQAQEAAFASSTAPTAAGQNASVVWYVALGLSILCLVLIVVNFYFDWRRSRMTDATIKE